MKRSEMLDRIEDTLRRTGNYCDGNQEVILYIIEKLGMLPPVRGNKGAFNTIRDEIDCTWEPEDEKK